MNIIYVFQATFIDPLRRGNRKRSQRNQVLSTIHAARTSPYLLSWSRIITSDRGVLAFDFSHPQHDKVSNALDFQFRITKQDRQQRSASVSLVELVNRIIILH